MAYNRTTWVDGSRPYINADNLNNIEEGILQNESDITDLQDAVTQAQSDISALQNDESVTDVLVDGTSVKSGRTAEITLPEYSLSKGVGIGRYTPDGGLHVISYYYNTIGLRKDVTSLINEIQTNAIFDERTTWRTFDNGRTLYSTQYINEITDTIPDGITKTVGTEEDYNDLLLKLQHAGVDISTVNLGRVYTSHTDTTVAEDMPTMYSAEYINDKFTEVESTIPTLSVVGSTLVIK